MFPFTALILSQSRIPDAAPLSVRSLGGAWID